MLKYFTDKELADPQTGIVQLADGFGRDLDKLREACGFPLTVNSCCRSAQYNDVLGGHSRSLHVYDRPFHPTGGCCAIDFGTHNLDGTQKAKLVKEALNAGFSVGVAKTFIHCDTRTSTLGMPQVLYTY
jgi:hypothetical protein